MPFSPTEGGPTIQGLSVGAEGALTLVTPAGLYRQTGASWDFAPRPKVQEQQDARKGLQLVYDLHDGKFWGTWGVPVTDAVSAALIVLVLTGYGLFFARFFKVRAARRRRAKAEAVPEVVTR
ncbi:hypothetical protein D3C78_1582920 [compost metagenome]